MKALKHIIRGVIWTVVIAYLAVIVAVRIPSIQSFIGSEVAEALAAKLGTRVEIGRVNLGFLNRIIVDDLIIYDQKRQKMVCSSRVAAKIDYYELLKKGHLYISSAQIFGFKGNFYKQDERTDANYQFALDSLASKDTTKQSTLELSINTLIIRHGAFKYDRHDLPFTPSKFNLSHIDVSDISAHITIPFYSKERIEASVKKLSLRESSGFDLRNMSFDLAYSMNAAQISDFNMRLPNSDLNIKRLKATYKMGRKGIEKNSLRYNGTLSSSTITPSDIACFVPLLKNNTNVVMLNADFHGDSKSLFVRKFNVKSPANGIILAAKGRVVGLDAKPKWTVDVSHLDCDLLKTSDALDHLQGLGFTMPEPVKRIGSASYKGIVSGSADALAIDGRLTTGVGDADIKLTKEQQRFKASVMTDGIDMGKLLADDKFGHIQTRISLQGAMTKDGVDDVTIDGTLPKVEYNSYPYQNIALNGTYRQRIFDGTLSMDDPNGQVKIEGKINTDLNRKEANIVASVRNLDPAQLRLTNRWQGYRFGFDVTSNTAGKANLRLSNFIMASAADSYELNSLEITSDNDRITMQSDFGWAEILGRCDVKTIAASFKNLVNSKLPSLCSNAGNTNNNFKLNAEINSSEWLNKLFNVPLAIEKPLKINADVNDRERQLRLLCSSDRFSYDGSPYEDLLITASTPYEELDISGRVCKIMANGHRLSLDLSANAVDDRLATSVSWNNHQAKPMMGNLNTETNFTHSESGKPDIHVKVNQSEILVNDTTWSVLPANIKYSNGTLDIDHFSIEHNKQHIKINGLATKNLTDSITIDLQDVDVNYVLDLINFHSVDFKGYATGKAFVKSVFYEPDFYADLKVNQFRFEDGNMGDLYANVSWNEQEKQIDINAHADERGGAQTIIKGYVSPQRNHIDLGIDAHDTNLEFIEGFCGAFMGDVKAHGNGSVRLHGPLNAINLTGLLTADGDVRIKPLNVVYTLKSDTIRLLPNNIVFNADTIRDRNGNIGIVDGALHHRNLSHLTYEFGVKTDNLLCYDTHDYDGQTFFGTAFGTGECTIRGGNGRIDIDINMTPNKGSFIEYNAASPDAIADQQFITWRDKTEENANSAANDTLSLTDVPMNATEPMDIPSDMRINFLIDMTPEATLRVLMDNSTGDIIALNGTGSIRASYFNKGSFDMFGTYLVERGIYQLTIQNIIKKVFQFQDGSSIVFGGDPYNAALSLKALYTVNGVPLSDLQLGNSFSSNNVRVDCIMNISGTPKQPRVDFDLDLPTVSNDAAQMVRTVINGEEEMNQQVVYLLGVGRFNIAKNNNSATEEGQQSQTSLAMQSLLSGTISQQINSLLGSMIKTNNWTFGANISTGDEGFNNAEYEGLLSGRLLNNRLILNGQFGYRDNANATTSFIGDFDINYLLLPNGGISLKVYNQTNDRYFTKSSLNTQGIGLIMKKDFNTLRELFGLKKKSRPTLLQQLKQSK